MMLYNQGMYLQARVWLREAPPVYKWEWTDYTPLESRDHILLIFVFA